MSRTSTRYHPRPLTRAAWLVAELVETAKEDVTILSTLDKRRIASSKSRVIHSTPLPSSTLVEVWLALLPKRCRYA